MKKDGFMTNMYGKVARKSLPFLAAATMSLPFASCTDRYLPTMPLKTEIEQEISPQEQEKAEQAKIWYKQASEDGIITPEELQDLETRIDIPVENSNKKQKTIYLTQLASVPEGDINQDGKENIYDLIDILRILSGTKEPTLASDIDNNNKTDVLDLIELLKILSGTYDTYLVKGQHFDNDTELGKRALLTINGEEYTTDTNGLFRIRMPKQSNYIITAQQDNGFKRTKEVSGADYTNLNIFSVSFPTQENVTPELFKAFCQEANFRGDPVGLKTMFGNEDGEFWISSHWDYDGATATAEDQTYVKGLTENEIYPHVKPENRFPIYVEDPNSMEDIPMKQYGKSVIIPHTAAGFYIATGDKNKDGIIDYDIIQLAQGAWNENYKRQILEELLSALVGPGQVTNYSGLTALQAHGEITEIDKKLINICQRYKPKTQIDYILGM